MSVPGRWILQSWPACGSGLVDHGDERQEREEHADGVYSILRIACSASFFLPSLLLPLFFPSRA